MCPPTLYRPPASSPGNNNYVLDFKGIHLTGLDLILSSVEGSHYLILLLLYRLAILSSDTRLLPIPPYFCTHLSPAGPAFITLLVLSSIGALPFIRKVLLITLCGTSFEDLLNELVSESSLLTPLKPPCS